MPAREDAYRRFLTTADLASWQWSLGCYAEFLEGRAALQADISAGIEALCISIYIAWFSARCAEPNVQTEARQRIQYFASHLRDRAALADERQRILAEGLIAASKGYSATGRVIVAELAPRPQVEVALLFMPTPPAARAAELRTYLARSNQPPFLPLIHFYAQALLELGYRRDVEHVLAAHRDLAGNPLLIDIAGTLHELAGAWHEARAAYETSDWAVHRYRAAICGVILGAGSHALVADGDQQQQKLALGMRLGGSEIDRAALARRTAFINACRWTDFDNWLVSFERGRLCFQRRQHTEAERHLRAAARTAPEGVQFEIQSLRYTNLSWLDEVSPVRELDMLPELLECGHAALMAAGSEADKASLRVDMAQRTQDLTLLGPVTDHADAYDRGLAHRIRGETPSSIAEWRAALSVEYTPRLMQSLIRLFASYGFERAAHALTIAARRECWDSFFEVWELADVLGDVLDQWTSGRFDTARLERQLAELEARTEALGSTDFQNAIRAFCSFWRRGRGQALSMLARAETLAETAEEFLQLAIARRSTARGGWDAQALAHLNRAERESKDRLERLQIAREFARCQRFPHARAILRAEDVFSDRLDLLPAEYVVVLQCGRPCLTQAELARLRQLAEAALKRDQAAGVFQRYPERFASRLRKYAVDSQLTFDDPLAQATAARKVSIWHETQAGFEQLRHVRQLSQEQRRLDQRIAELAAADGAHFARYALWGLVFDQFESDLTDAERRRPDLPDTQTPISRSEPALSARRDTLAALWRTHLLASDPKPGLDAIHAFQAEERDLEARWESARKRDVQEPLARLRYLSLHAVGLLGAIREQEDRSDMWPFFLHLREALLDDAQALAEQLDERIGHAARL